MKRIAIALLFATCGWAADLPGRYVLEGVAEVASELVLRPDGTFEYMLIYGAADYQAKGKWQRDGDAVVLNTASPDSAPFRLTNSAAGEAGGFRVWVKAPNGRGVQHIDVVLETASGEAKERTGSDGSAEFPEISGVRSVKLHVPVYNVEAGPFPADPKRHELSFEINGEAITSVPFKGERLKVSDGALEMRFWNKDRVMRYHKR